MLPIKAYDKIIVSLSGGKDSIACLIHLMEFYKPLKEKVVCWHQSVDAHGEDKIPFMDWPSTEGYCRAIAKHFDIPIEFQWRQGGFHTELMRANATTAAVKYTHNGETVTLPSNPDPRFLTTRLRWPAKSANLSVRWCSSALKIDPARRVIADLFPANQKKPLKTLFITGERKEESASRAKYVQCPPHPCDCQGRRVDHFRMVLNWPEKMVWDSLRRNKILPHPAYYLGLPRLSCCGCIFCTKNHYATLADAAPEAMSTLVSKEQELKHTIDNETTLSQMIMRGVSKITQENMHWIPWAVEPWGDKSIITENWELPCGAYSGGGGGAI